MRRFYTAEAVTEGHPDKVCDQIADAILDDCLRNDETSRVACEVLATKGTILVAGEITSSHEPDVFGIIRSVMEGIGYPAQGIAMDTLVHRQSLDIAGAVTRSKEAREGLCENQSDWTVGAGDQGIMIGYACEETPQPMPMPVVLANRIVRELSASRKSSYIQGILPDGKAQVTVEYENGKPVRLDSVVVSCQYMEEEYQCIQYALDKPGVVTVLPGVRNREDLKRILGFVNAPEEEKDYSVLGSFDVKDAAGVCVYCNHCQPCPAGLDVGLINKYYDLAQAGDELAKSHYANLEKKAGDCIGCGHCDARCPFHVIQTERMQEIQAYFGRSKTR